MFFHSAGIWNRPRKGIRGNNISKNREIHPLPPVHSCISEELGFAKGGFPAVEKNFTFFLQAVPSRPFPCGGAPCACLRPHARNSRRASPRNAAPTTFRSTCRAPLPQTHGTHCRIFSDCGASPGGSSSPAGPAGGTPCSSAPTSRVSSNTPPPAALRFYT